MLNFSNNQLDNKVVKGIIKKVYNNEAIEVIDIVSIHYYGINYSQEIIFIQKINFKYNQNIIIIQKRRLFSFNILIFIQILFGYIFAIFDRYFILLINIYANVNKKIELYFT